MAQLRQAQESNRTPILEEIVDFNIKTLQVSFYTIYLLIIFLFYKTLLLCSGQVFVDNSFVKKNILM